jgi:transposase-like protein
VTDLPKRDLFQCSDCRYQFSVTTGTIMHDTHLPLQKWLMGIYLIVEGKKGISARQLGRSLNVAYKTAWYLSHRIRESLKTPEALLSGIIEVDETWIGGRVRGKGKGYKLNKTMVVGAAERAGGVRLEAIQFADRRTLHGFIDKHVAPDTESIYTYELAAYGDLNDEDTVHEKVAHAQEEWVRGDVHTNTIEGVWALFKRGVAGSFHKVSRKHLQRYLDEFEFRFNNRNNPFVFRDALRELVTAPRLQFAELTE